MKMTASRKKPAQGLQLDEIYLGGAQERVGFWTDEAQGARPLSSRKDIQEFDAVQSRAANDAEGRSRQQPRPRGGFLGSRHFWWALAASIGFCVLFALLMGFGNAQARAALFSNPAHYAPFWASLAAIAAIQCVFALSAYRQATTEDMLRRVMIATQRFQEPSAVAEEAGRRINTSFDHLFAGIDARMALLDERSALFAEQIAASMHQSTEAADVSINNMRSIVEASETQREALQRTGMMISTEVMPVIAKLETTVLSLQTVSQTAGNLLDTIGSKLQQTTQDLKTSLDAFTHANHNVAPELEKRMAKFEASIAQLPEQLDATIGRLGPLSDTIADAAMLSTANIEVIDQLAKDITAMLDRSRSSFTELSTTGAQLFQQAVDAHAGRFREMLESIVSEEASRVSGLSRELGQLGDQARAVVDRLQQPVGDVTAATERALANVNDSLDGLDQRIAVNLSACVGELNDVAARLVSSVNREIETSALGLQTKLAAGATELMQRVHADTARFENLIGETAERSSSRIASAIKDLPAVLAQRMDTEIGKIDVSLKGSLFGVSDQMRQILDAVPSRLSALTRETLHTLESNIERSISDVSQRSELLNEQFRRNATETTETILQGYVDFIFLAADRFRKELEEVNGTFTRDLETRLRRSEPDGTASEADPAPHALPEAALAEPEPEPEPDETRDH
jgi:hypothetical protein